MGLTRDFASLSHDRYAFIEKEVFPRRRPKCNQDAWLAKYLETQDRELGVGLITEVQTISECHAGPRGGTERSDSECWATRGHRAFGQ